MSFFIIEINTIMPNRVGDPHVRPHVKKSKNTEGEKERLRTGVSFRKLLDKVTKKGEAFLQNKSLPSSGIKTHL